MWCNTCNRYHCGTWLWPFSEFRPFILDTVSCAISAKYCEETIDMSQKLFCCHASIIPRYLFTRWVLKSALQLPEKTGLCASLHSDISTDSAQWWLQMHKTVKLQGCYSFSQDYLTLGNTLISGHVSGHLFLILWILFVWECCKQTHKVLFFYFYTQGMFAASSGRCMCTFRQSSEYLYNLYSE